MPVLDGVLSRFGLQRKADPPQAPIFNDNAGNLPTIRVRYATVGTNSNALARSYESLAVSGYKSNSDVFSCVSLISSAGKQVKWDTAPGSRSQKSIALLNRSGGATLIESWL